MEEPVSYEDYDKHVIAQGLQFQIDNYYNPKNIEMKRRIEIILGKLKPVPNEKILDLGCGVGTFAYHCAKAEANTWGLDYSYESIKAAKELCDKFEVAKNTNFLVHDVKNGLPFSDSFFDKIVVSDFIEHITHKQKIGTLTDMKRVLKPDGTIIVFTPNGLREKLGEIKRKLQRLIGIEVKETKLHFGLIDRFQFEKMIRNSGLKYKRYFYDVNKPFLAGLPLLKEVLALELLWIIKK